MNEKNTPGVPGQDPTSTDNPNPTTNRDLVTEVEETLASVDDAMPRVQRAAHYRELISLLERAASAARRLAALAPEEEPEGDDEDEPLTEPGPGPTPALALRSDGSVLLSVEYLDAASLEGRAVWIGVVLSYAEACDAADRLADAACDAGAHIGGRLIALARKKKAKREREGGNGDE